jgi:hypothetical protein
LAHDFPRITSLREYTIIEEIPDQVVGWIKETFPPGSKVRTLPA